MAISADPLEDARRSAEAFPRLTILSDPERTLGTALGALDPEALRPVEHEIFRPLQVIVDGAGRIESVWAGRNVAERRPVDAILAAIRGGE